MSRCDKRLRQDCYTTGRNLIRNAQEFSEGLRGKGGTHHGTLEIAWMAKATERAVQVTANSAS